MIQTRRWRIWTPCKGHSNHKSNSWFLKVKNQIKNNEEKRTRFIVKHSSHSKDKDSSAWTEKKQKAEIKNTKHFAKKCSTNFWNHVYEDFSMKKTVLQKLNDKKQLNIFETKLKSLMLHKKLVLLIKTKKQTKNWETIIKQNYIEVERSVEYMNYQKEIAILTNFWQRDSWKVQKWRN